MKCQPVTLVEVSIWMLVINHFYYTFMSKDAKIEQNNQVYSRS